MPTCPKCRTRVKREYEFCPRCGTALKPAPAAPAPPYRGEKYEKYEKEEAEKEEKEEKEEKYEKHERYEKRELGYVGPLVGGLILICLGLMLYMVTQFPPIPRQVWVALFFVVVGIIVIAAGVYAVIVGARRSPRP